MRLFKVKCKKTLIMEVHHDIFEDDYETFVDSNQLEISYFKGYTYTLLEILEDKLYVSIDEDDNLHKFDLGDFKEYFDVITSKEIE